MLLLDRVKLLSKRRHDGGAPAIAALSTQMLHITYIFISFCRQLRSLPMEGFKEVLAWHA
jgi:hypothetical protein